MPAEYPGAEWIPAHKNGWGYSGASPNWKAVVVHTPEEDADDREITPQWFKDPRAGVSTHFYVDNDGDVVQMVSLKQGAYAHGIRTVDRIWTPSWCPPGISFNMRAVGIEVEGRHASIHHTMKVGGAQFNSLVALIKWLSKPSLYFHLSGFNVNSDNVIGHNRINQGKDDPGKLFPWNALLTALVPDPMVGLKNRLRELRGLQETFSIEQNSKMIEVWREIRLIDQESH